MNHEPECFVGEPNRLGLPAFYCICDNLEAAYKRGREDAARAVEQLPKIDCQKDVSESWVAYGSYGVLIDSAIAAARGDGEQA